jgi:hypothetical protein
MYLVLKEFNFGFPVIVEVEMEGMGDHFKMLRCPLSESSKGTTTDVACAFEITKNGDSLFPNH